MSFDSFAHHGKDTYNVDRDEALRYLGYTGQQVDGSLTNRIDEIFERCETVSQPSWVYRIFPVDASNGTITLTGTTLVLEGNDIYQHLHEASHCAVLAATCGLANERELQRLNRVGGFEALVFDAASSALVEVAADACNAHIVAQAHDQGLFTNYRYGPGYGDLALDIQGAILDVLGAGKTMGMSVTPSNLLVPTKSITAFVGCFDRPQASQPTCANCSFKPHCTLRKKGQTCYR